MLSVARPVCCRARDRPAGGDAPGMPSPRIVLITGASSGIGRETALRFARGGDTVVAVARQEPALRALAAEQPGIEIETCELDDAAARADLVARVLDRHPRVDVLVNNAGVVAVGLLQDLTGADVERVYSTNVIAYADLARLLLPQMLERGSGAIVNLSSAAAWVSAPPSTIYSSSKFAVDGLIEGLRRETRGTGVLVHSINPGPIATNFLAHAAERSPQPGDPEVAPSPGFPAAWVADAVYAAAGARHPLTRAVPRPMGLLRLAQVPPVGFALDVVMSRLARPLVDRTQKMVADRTKQLPRQP